MDLYAEASTFKTNILLYFMFYMTRIEDSSNMSDKYCTTFGFEANIGDIFVPQK